MAPRIPAAADWIAYMYMYMYVTLHVLWDLKERRHIRIRSLIWTLTVLICFSTELKMEQDVHVHVDRGRPYASGEKNIIFQEALALISGE